MESLVGSHVVCTWFPDHGDHLVAAEDLAALSAFSPAGKIFVCEGIEGPWSLVRYGSAIYRVSAEVLTAIASPSFEVGQEVAANGAVGEVRSRTWHFERRAPIYGLSFAGKPSTRWFDESELTPATAALTQPPRLILASASPARRQTLINAGLRPEIIVSHVDEDDFSAPDVVGLVNQLARAKADRVFSELGGTDDVVVVACDSLLELRGEPMGKPADAQQAIQRWRQMRGSTGQLHTGHHVIARRGGTVDSASAVATTEVMFANLDDDEIEAYVGTGEPLKVAGAFTVDGLGGGYVTGVCGDPHNVVGISLPLLRRLLLELGVPWHSLWH